MKRVNQIVLRGILVVWMMLGGVSSMQAVSVMELMNDSPYEVNESDQPKASLVYELETGRIVWENQADLKWKTASVSKLMTIFVALGKLGEEGLNQTITITQPYVDMAQDYNLSNNNMQLGATYTIQELLDLIVVPSSNAATLLLSDIVSDGDRALFVQWMNETASQLGMENSTFYNPLGAPNKYLGVNMVPGADPEGDNESTARDLGILTYHLLKKYPFILDHSKNRVVTVKAGTPYEETFESHLHSLPGAIYEYEGFDGIKTGSSGYAGFNMSATAKRGETRFVEILLGIGDWSNQDGEMIRHTFGNVLLDYAFDRYEYRLLAEKGEVEIDGQTYLLAEDYYDVVPKDSEPILTYQAADKCVSVQSELAALKEDVGERGVKAELKTINPLKKSTTKTTTSLKTMTFWHQWQQLPLTLKGLFSIIVVLVLLIILLIIALVKKWRRH